MGRNFDQEIDIPATAWLVEDPGHKILVDTGMCDTERAVKYHYAGSCQKAGERIDQALEKMRIKTHEIDTVIYTHLHWDHCANCQKFPKAKHVVQKKEWEFALNPIFPYHHSYEFPKIGITADFRSIKMELLDGDAEIFPGIRVLSTPGHSPGHQSVQIVTPKGRFVIAGDAVMTYDNLEKDPKRSSPFCMIGRYMDFEKTWASFEKIVAAADYILPAHDFRVFEELKLNL